MVGYALENAENAARNVVHACAPLAVMFGEPINRIDDVLCKSLAVVEQNIPFVTYTPRKVSTVCCRPFQNFAAPFFCLVLSDVLFNYQNNKPVKHSPIEWNAF